MACLYRDSVATSVYKDKKFKFYDEGHEEYEQTLLNSSTIYVGNLSFYTTEEQIYSLFSKCGDIQRIIMGLDRQLKTPCGFCFVEFFEQIAALNSVWHISGTRLDDRVIRCDLDTGFEEGRQYGRGKSGGQIRDEHRTEYDPGRGGYSPAAAIIPAPNQPLLTESPPVMQQFPVMQQQVPSAQPVMYDQAGNPVFADNSRKRGRDWNDHDFNNNQRRDGWRGGRGRGFQGPKRGRYHDRGHKNW